jgi:Fic family protein
MLRERIQTTAVDVSWVPALQKDSRVRNVHASTAIEGNPLSLDEVREIEEEGDSAVPAERSHREVQNYIAGLRYIEKHATKKSIRHEDVFALHRILAKGVMDQGEAGRYRTVAVKVGRYTPPRAADVSGLMFELLSWWNERATDLSPVLSSAILHYRFESIHPFADGNGRTGRALAMWELYRRGFDTHHIFSIDEYYWEDRPAYYAALDTVRHEGEDLTHWLEYCAAGLNQTLEHVWTRIQTLQCRLPDKVVLSAKQELLLQLLRDRGSLAPSEIWAELDLSKQGALNLLNPLLEAGLIERIGGKKTGRYTLRKA